MITLVQPILILVLVAILLIYIRRFRTRLFDRAVIILFLLLGIVMVMFPDLTTVIAHYFGVGRGADGYVFWVIWLCFCKLAPLFQSQRP